MPEFHPGHPQGNPAAHEMPSAPPDWKTALMDLIAARAEIIRIELADFRKQSARRATLVTLAILAGASGWLLLLAGSVPLLAQAIGISWPVVSLILAALHLVFLGVFLAMAQRHSGTAFTSTLSEFQKDREWIESLSKTPKS